MGKLLNATGKTLEEVMQVLNATRIVRSDPRDVAAVADGDYSGLDDGDYAEVDALLEAAKCSFDPQKLSMLAKDYLAANSYEWTRLPASTRKRITASSTKFETVVAPAIFDTWDASFHMLLDARFKRLSLTFEHCGRRSIVDESRNLAVGSSCLAGVDRIIWAYACAANLPTTHANRNKVLGFIVLSTLANPEVCRRVPGRKRKFNPEYKLEDAVLEWLMQVRSQSEQQHSAGCFLLHNLGHPTEMLPRDRGEVLQLPGQHLCKFIQWELDAVAAYCPPKKESSNGQPVPLVERSIPLTLTRAGQILTRDRSLEGERRARTEIHELMEQGKLRAEIKKPGGFLWYFDLRDIRKHWPELLAEFEPKKPSPKVGKVGNSR